MKLTIGQALQKAIEAHKAGQLREADKLYRAILNAQPRHPDANHNLGVLEVGVGKVQEALPFFKMALEANPTIAQFWLSYIDALIKSGEFQLVDEVTKSFQNSNFDKATIEKVGCQIYLKLGLAHQSRNEFKTAEELFRKSIETDPLACEAYIHLGLLYKIMEAPLKSLDAFELARNVFPLLPQVYTNACEVCEKYNMIEEFSEWISKAEKAFDELPLALEFSKIVLMFRSFNYIEVTKQLTPKFIGKLDDDRQILALEIIAKSNDFLGNYEKAIGYFKRMNLAMEEKNKSLGISSEETINFYEKQFQSLIEIPDTYKNVDAQINSNISVSFIIGFPRSGSTLISKMLNAHPRIQCLDEYPLIPKAKSMITSTAKAGNDLILSKQDKLSVRKFYDTLVMTNFAKNNECIFIDKRPLNILEIPLISQLFPEGNILCLIRHPCDVILSCWMQNFNMNSVMSTTTSIEKLTTLYCLSMQTLIATQGKLQADISFLQYEKFISSPKAMLSQYITELGLAWSNEIEDYRDNISKTEYISTPSYLQVIQPIYKDAIYRWENYRSLFLNHADELNPWIKRFEYDNFI